MKWLILPLAVLAMIILLGVAVAVDCARLSAAARGRVQIADAELQKHELRLIQLLSGSPLLSSDVRTAITAYRGAASPPARHEAYGKLVAEFRRTMSSKVDPTNPLDRQFMDEIAGAINRREIAQKSYDDELAPYEKFSNSTRGRIARWFSP